MSSATTQGAPLAGSNFTPFGELYNPYPGGENAFFAGMLGIADSGPLTDGYQSATRFYSNLQGRWTSPDTAGLSAVDPTNPQSWNRYAYVMNNPLSGTDTSGMDGNCTTYSGVNSQGYWITVYCTYYSGVIVINVPVGGPTAGVGQTGGGGASGAPNSGLTKKQAACAADAAINGALSIFVPGYAATKALASFGGFSFNPVQAVSSLLVIQHCCRLQEDWRERTKFIKTHDLPPPVVASALARVQDLTSRVGFGAQTASRQGRLLSQLGNLESLEGAASFASKANNVTAAISAGYDIYKCVTTP